MKKMTTKAAMALVITAGGLQSPLLMADEAQRVDNNRGWYVGGALSYAEGEVKVRGTRIMEEEGAGFGVYSGYNFSDWFGLEGASFHSDNLRDNREGLDSANFFTLSFMPKLMVNFNDTFGIFFKAGPTFVMYTEEYDRDTGRRYRDDEYDWSEIRIGGGLGAELAVQHNVKVRLAYDYVSGTLDENWYERDAPSSRVDVDLGRYSLGVHYQF